MSKRMCSWWKWNRESRAAGSRHSYKKWVNGRNARRKRHTINSIFHVSYSRSHFADTHATVCVYASIRENVLARICMCECIGEWMNEQVSEWESVRVFRLDVFESDKPKIINNHVNEQEKEGEHIEWQAERIILCLLYFNSEKQTQYYDICGLNVAVAVAVLLVSLFFSL